MYCLNDIKLNHNLCKFYLTEKKTLPTYVMYIILCFILICLYNYSSITFQTVIIHTVLTVSEFFSVVASHTFKHNCFQFNLYWNQLIFFLYELYILYIIAQLIYVIQE